MRALPLSLTFVAIVALASCSSDDAKKNGATTPTDGGAPVTTGPLALAAGEVAEIQVKNGRAQATFTANAGDRYVAIVASTKIDVSSASFDFSAALEGDGEATGVRKVDGCALAKFAGTKPQDEPEPTGTAPTVGATKSIRVSSGLGGETITVKAAAVGKRAIVWVDDTPAHPATMDAAFITEFLKDFEDVILPRERTLFGTESDVDGDGRISLVFSPLTKTQAVAYFSGCDIKKLDGCGQGNAGEYLYLTPPADIDPPYNTPAAIKETLAHELGHLIHFGRKVHKNDLSSWPDGAYMIEGFGGFTQDVVGFQAGNFYVAQAGLQKIDEFSLGDVFGFREAYDKTRDGGLRGGSYWLVRYLYDRAGGDVMDGGGVIEDKGGPSFLRGLLESPKSISDAVGAQVSLADVGTDFYTALVLSNESKAGLVDPTNACFSFLPAATDPITNRQRGADTRAEFHGQKLTGPATKKLASADGKLRSGGVEYLTFDAAGETTIRVTVDGAAAPRVRVARTK